MAIKKISSYYQLSIDKKERLMYSTIVFVFERKTLIQSGHQKLMFIIKPLPFVTTFIEELNQGIKEYNPDQRLSRTQKAWIGFCIMAILMTNTVCWAKFERASIGKYSLAAISGIVG